MKGPTYPLADFTPGTMGEVAAKLQSLTNAVGGYVDPALPISAESIGEIDRALERVRSVVMDTLAEQRR